MSGNKEAEYISNNNANKNTVKNEIQTMVQNRIVVIGIEF